MHLNSKLLFQKYAVPYFKNNLKVLEIGPAGYPSAYQQVINNPSITWDTVDFADTTFIDNAVSNLSYKISDPYVFPIEDNVYDIVLSGQVIEHVEKIWEWLKEIKRVVKPDGLILTINPVSWPYHEAPIDCWRIFPNGIKALADENNLSVELNLFESLEEEYLKSIFQGQVCIPGKSYNYENSEKKINLILKWNKIMHKIPKVKNYFTIPIEVSVDTISILKKI
jgi:ubiquinone/menaquinone biosynthesis C-methylase UbiE